MSASGHGKQKSRTVPADQILEALFAAVVEEVRRSPAFARRLMSVFPDAIVARVERNTAKHASFDAGAYHAVNILRQHGESMLRGRLCGLRTKAELGAVAKRSGLRLTGRAARKTASRAEIIDGIVEAAKHYDAQRSVTQS